VKPKNRGQEKTAQKGQEPLKKGPQEVESVRAKSSGHGKKTADKWNQ
jgi:hypothetical protein